MTGAPRPLVLRAIPPCPWTARSFPSSSLDTGIEVFNGPVVIKHLENWKYPDTVFDIVRMVMEDELGKRGVIITKSGSSNMDYSRDSFDWDAGDDGMVEAYNVKHVQESDGSRGWVRIKATNMSNPPSCEIEGAERLYVVEKKRDDKDHPYLEVTQERRLRLGALKATNATIRRRARSRVQTGSTW